MAASTSSSQPAAAKTRSRNRAGCMWRLRWGSEDRKAALLASGRAKFCEGSIASRLFSRDLFLFFQELLQLGYRDCLADDDLGILIEFFQDRGNRFFIGSRPDCPVRQRDGEISTH